ncbi:MAG: T9SS C-terminal target domain-containing protein [Crocinitomicaceae bacterium]|nr:T9SS C-terminal target domain-containing protein [Crocinitomicaceae bacterium]
MHCLQFSALNNDSQLLVIDARGRLVRKIVVPKNTESLPLDISSLAAGEYFLQIENEVLKEKRKVVKF